MPRQKTEDLEEEDLEEDLEGPPQSIDPYKVLGIETSASADQVKSAYRKLALKHHPDKAEDKATAHTKFQEIAFAYAILSDSHRRSRYDTTGNTAESLDDDFDWADFFRAQKELVTPDAIKKFKKEYQGSEEETNDLLAAFTECKGDMDAVYEVVMCSDDVQDDKRFRQIIDQAIADKKVKRWKQYGGGKNVEARERRAAKEAKEAEAHAKELKLDSSSDLSAMIQARQKSRGNIFDSIHAKYGGGAVDEPPEEAFARNRPDARAKRSADSDVREGGKKAKTSKGRR